MILAKEDVQWVVNDNAELGVKIGDQFFWLYKGTSLTYHQHDDDLPLLWRFVEKREFGECCHPEAMVRADEVKTPYQRGSGWQEVPPDPITHTTPPALPAVPSVPDGGPAFPQTDLSAYGMGPAAINNGGMSLRDWFAGQALVGLLGGQYGDSSTHNLSEVPKEAYLVADAMLRARKETA